MRAGFITNKDFIVDNQLGLPPWVAREEEPTGAAVRSHGFGERRLTGKGK